MPDFKAQMAEYKQQIDAALDVRSLAMVEQTINEFGTQPAEAVKAYSELLNRGGKRIRGVLTMLSYYMHGGTDVNVAIESACAVEMLQAYILMVDDIQDRSETRRGGPAGHIILRNYHHENNLAGDAQHFGESIAMDGFLFGAHSAIDVLADLSISADDRLRAIKNVNKHFISTAHGQTLDIMNEATQATDESLVDQVLIWKTAFYTILNPLQLGGILAGASNDSLDQLKPFALSAGRAFQITDDIIGVFGDDTKTGKASADDIREGKRTILSVKALKETDREDAEFLESMLGNDDITDDQFGRCKQIIQSSGALDYARSEAEIASKKAVAELNILKNSSQNYKSEHLELLEQITVYFTTRQA